MVTIRWLASQTSLALTRKESGDSPRAPELLLLMPELSMIGISHDHTPVRRRKSSSASRWLLIGVALAVVVIAISGILLTRNWPFTERAVKQALQDRFARQVEIRGFRMIYWPPGCVVDGISFLHHQRKDLPPLITVQSLTIRGSYAGLLGIHKRVPEIRVVGLHVLVPPKRPDGHSSNLMPLTTSTSGKQLGIGELTTDDALLEFRSAEPGKESLKMPIHRLTLDHVGESDSIGFHAAFLNTEPPGEIRSEGRIGPWNEDDPGSTPVSGSYTYENVNLGAFQGLGGTLSSRGKFSGTFGHLDAEGQVDVPNFNVSTSSHTVHLTSEFQAVVDAMNGDVSLQNVRSSFRRTIIVAKGAVSGHPGQKGKTVALDMTVKDGRIQDLLYLFTEDKNPSMTGTVNLRAKVEVPPGPPGFLTKLSLISDVGIGSGRFTNPTVQMPVNKLTESARGETKQQEAEDPQTVLSNLRGRVSVKNGVATLLDTSFTAPGTRAEIGGNYNLLNKTVDLRGVLYTNGKLADTTSGFKAVVLKGLSPFLKKKNVTIVPFTITGTSSDPKFAMDLDGKRHL